MISYEIPAVLTGEIDGLEKAIGQYRSGSLNPVKFRGIRVPFGIYEQRKDDTYMVRSRCAAGIVTPLQLKRAAELSKQYGNAYLHVTTRQALQIHDVQLENTVKAIRGLLDVGLSTRGGGGNTVRNIVASVDSGIDLKEAFDVTPYALALTSALIAEPDSWTLPRKYKIAFSNSKSDTAGAAFTDLGFIAAMKDGQRGFRVYVAGGLGRKPETGHLLYEFVLPEKVYPIAEGLKRLFDKHGNRKDKNSARLRFLWEKLGPEKFVRLLEKEIAEVEAQGITLHVSDQKKTGLFKTPDFSVNEIRSKEFHVWKERYVRKQKQAGLSCIKVPLRLGDIRNDDAIRLSEFLEQFGRDVLRFSPNQNIHIRNFDERYLGNLHDVISQLETLSEYPEIIGDTVACTGSSTCKLGITLSREAVRAITNNLIKHGLDLDALAGLHLQVSGCPNSCGRHMTSDLGFFGKVGRKEGKSYPAYNVVAGSVSGNAGARLALHLGEVSSRDLPALVHDILRGYISRQANYESFSAFVSGEGGDLIRRACETYCNIPVFQEDRNYYYDWGAETVFSIAGRGVGECSAGVLDLIDYDAGIIGENRKKLDSATGQQDEAQTLYQIALAGSRMLLVTRGVDAKTDTEVFDAFAEHFINRGYVPAEFKELLAIAKNGNREKLLSLKEEVVKLSETVLELYRNMDDSLNFNTGEVTVAVLKNTATEKPALRADRFKDYRGVACPINFVKVKIDLAAMKSGETLEVLLDDGAPIEKVPASVMEQGNVVLHKKKIDNYWSLLIRKAQAESCRVL